MSSHSETNLQTHATISVSGRSVQISTGLFINNEFVTGHGHPIVSLNPSDQSILATVCSASEEDIDLAVNAARLASQTTWGTHAPGPERAKLMNRLADVSSLCFSSRLKKNHSNREEKKSTNKASDVPKLMELRLEDLAFLETVDSGKGITWARGDLTDSLATFRYYAALAFSSTDGHVLERNDQTGIAFTRQEPLPVVAQIVPWNYPIMMMAWKVAPALATGCAIVFKPAEQTPLATLLFCELIREAGYPAGAFNCVNSYGPVGGRALSRHPAIDKIAFTGSTPIGKQVAVEAAQSNLKKVSLELGGKSPNIVFESADIEQAAAWCCLGIFENMGQSCTASSRILVQSSIYDPFLNSFLKKASSHKLGDPLDPQVYSGPQISSQHLERIMGYVQCGIEEGAKLVLGGKTLDRVPKFNSNDKEPSWLEGGNFMQPTVFVDTEPWMKIVKEEIFGPVAIVIKFETVEEAIKIANQTEYGLAAGIHTQKQDQIVRVSQKLNAGTVWINSYAFCPPNVPFGGFKSSGWGRELGQKGIEEYTITKSYQWNYSQKFNWPFELKGITKL